jgi:hypothetical protein
VDVQAKALGPFSMVLLSVSLGAIVGVVVLLWWFAGHSGGGLPPFFTWAMASSQETRDGSTEAALADTAVVRARNQDIVVQFESTPAGAEVSFIDDDEVLGTTPLIVSFARSDAKREVEYRLVGFQPIRRSMEFNSDLELSVVLDSVAETADASTGDVETRDVAPKSRRTPRAGATTNVAASKTSLHKAKADTAPLTGKKRVPKKKVKHGAKIDNTELDELVDPFGP